MKRKNQKRECASPSSYFCPLPPLRHCVLILVTVSHLGWCFEKLMRYAVYGSLADRGFLSLPLCPIYGFCIVFSGLLLGSPQSPSPLLWRLGRRLPPPLFYGLYLLFAILLSTAAELSVGLIFLRAGIPLWDYSQRFGNFMGVICPFFSLLFGSLITLSMALLWDRLLALLGRLSRRTAGILALIFSLLMSADLLFNLVYLALTGEHFTVL